MTTVVTTVVTVTVYDFPAPLMYGLVAYWPGNEASGNLIDAHSGGRDMTEAGTVGADTGHVYATARDFSPWASDPPVRYFSRADTALADEDNASFTWAAWVYLDSLGENAADYMGIYSNISGSTGANMKIAYQGQIAMQAWQASPASLITIHSAVGSVTTGSWHLCMGWVDYARRKVGCRVNGGADAIETLVDFNGRTESTTYVGREAAANGDGIDGLIGPVMKWSRALPDAELDALYNEGNGLTYSEMAAYTGD